MHIYKVFSIDVFPEDKSFVRCVVLTYFVMLYFRYKGWLCGIPGCNKCLDDGWTGAGIPACSAALCQSAGYSYLHSCLDAGG